MSYELVTLPAYRAIGMRWQGTYAEVVPHLKSVIREMEERASELEYKLNPSFQLGLSYHVIEDGFAHYAVYQVSEQQEIPNGMIEIYIPQWTYVKTEHHKGQNIGNTYNELQRWLDLNGYIPLREANTVYFDPMPIKHEYYPAEYDKNDPHFDIYIPVVRND